MAERWLFVITQPRDRLWGNKGQNEKLGLYLLFMFQTFLLFPRCHSQLLSSPEEGRAHKHEQSQMCCPLPFMESPVPCPAAQAQGTMEM